MIVVLGFSGRILLFLGDTAQVLGGNVPCCLQLTRTWLIKYLHTKIKANGTKMLIVSESK